MDGVGVGTLSGVARRGVVGGGILKNNGNNGNSMQGSRNMTNSPREIPRQNSGIMACRSEATQNSNVSGGDETAVAPYPGGTYSKGTMA